MVRSMLEKAIEIEGLLRIIRDGNPLSETYMLLSMKASELAEEAMRLEEEAKEAQKTQETPHAKEPEGSLVIEESPVEDDDILLTLEDEEDLELEDHDESLTVVDNVVFEPKLNVEFTVTPAAQETKRSERKQLIQMTQQTQAALPKQQIQAVQPKQQTQATLPKQPTQAVQPKQQTKQAQPTQSLQTKGMPNLKSKFSLNDRFLYSRELFDGNMKMFDSTLAFIEGIDSFAIIEDYFYSELEWDPENRFVASFMEILRPNFKE